MVRPVLQRLDACDCQLLQEVVVDSLPVLFELFNVEVRHVGHSHLAYRLICGIFEAELLHVLLELLEGGLLTPKGVSVSLGVCFVGFFAASN